jgi:hypothetical protein
VGSLFEGKDAKPLRPLLKEGNERTGVIIGPSGSGKTQVVLALSKQMRVRIHELDKGALSEKRVSFYQISDVDNPEVIVIDDVHFLLNDMHLRGLSEEGVLGELESIADSARKCGAKLILVMDSPISNFAGLFGKEENIKRFLRLVKGCIANESDGWCFNEHIGREIEDFSKHGVLDLSKRAPTTAFQMEAYLPRSGINLIEGIPRALESLLKQGGVHRSNAILQIDGLLEGLASVSSMLSSNAALQASLAEERVASAEAVKGRLEKLRTFIPYVAQRLRKARNELEERSWSSGAELNGLLSLSPEDQETMALLPSELIGLTKFLIKAVYSFESRVRSQLSISEEIPLSYLPGYKTASKQAREAYAKALSTDSYWHREIMFNIPDRRGSSGGALPKVPIGTVRELMIASMALGGINKKTLASLGKIWMQESGPTDEFSITPQNLETLHRLIRLIADTAYGLRPDDEYLSIVSAGSDPEKMRAEGMRAHQRREEWF